MPVWGPTRTVQKALAGYTLANDRCYLGHDRKCARKGGYYVYKYETFGEEGQDQVLLNKEFRFSDDFLTCRGSVTNMCTFTCPCMCAPCTDSTGSLESAEGCCSRDGGCKAAGGGGWQFPRDFSLSGLFTMSRDLVLVLLYQNTLQM